MGYGEPTLPNSILSYPPESMDGSAVLAYMLLVNPPTASAIASVCSSHWMAQDYCGNWYLYIAKPECVPESLGWMASTETPATQRLWWPMGVWRTEVKWTHTLMEINT